MGLTISFWREGGRRGLCVTEVVYILAHSRTCINSIVSDFQVRQSSFISKWGCKGSLLEVLLSKCGESCTPPLIRWYQ